MWYGVTSLASAANNPTLSTMIAAKMLIKNTAQMNTNVKK
jgi:hypothetical protein